MFSSVQNSYYSSIGRNYYMFEAVKPGEKVKLIPLNQVDTRGDVETKGCLLGRGYYADYWEQSAADRKPLTPNYDDLASRLTAEATARSHYVVSFVFSILTSFGDGVVGAPAAALSLLTVGASTNLNRFAYRQLRSFSRMLFSAPYEDFLHIINPQTLIATPNLP